MLSKRHSTHLFFTLLLLLNLTISTLIHPATTATTSSPNCPCGFSIPFQRGLDEERRVSEKHSNHNEKYTTAFETDFRHLHPTSYSLPRCWEVQKYLDPVGTNGAARPWGREADGEMVGVRSLTEAWYGQHGGRGGVRHGDHATRHSGSEEMTGRRSVRGDGASGGHEFDGLRDVRGVARDESESVTVGEVGGSGGVAGLELSVSGREEAVRNGFLIKTGEVMARRSDMWVGSFRVGLKVGPAGGGGGGMAGSSGEDERWKRTCIGIFWYHSPTHEIDLELLTREFNASAGKFTAHLVMQTPDYDNSKSPDTYQVVGLPIDPADGFFHEYRFDILEGGDDGTETMVRFYVDGRYLSTVHYDYRKSTASEGENRPKDGFRGEDRGHDSRNPGLLGDRQGNLFINHWSNGNPLWSGGPPETRATVTVGWVRVYFNSSDPEVMDEARRACDAARDGESSGGKGVCTVHDYGDPGWQDTTDIDDLFFRRGMCGEVGLPTEQPSSDATGASSDGRAAARPSGNDGDARDGGIQRSVGSSTFSAKGRGWSYADLGLCAGGFAHCFCSLLAIVMAVTVWRDAQREDRREEDERGQR
ncbi:MAG: hypothetical protein M1831_004200 [Alyxoria varia]|nr:MAG: hypothetical protein M1831_004200 [Alyxoria varia]